MLNQMSSTQIKHLLAGFRDIISSGWQPMLDLELTDTYGSMRIDWLQANWEIFVEGPLAGGRDFALEVYGEGADCNGASSRVIFPERLATHKIVCVAESDKQLEDLLSGRPIDPSDLDVDFDMLVSLSSNSQYAEELPFNKVLGTQGSEIYVLDFESVGFELRSVGSGSLE